MVDFPQEHIGLDLFIRALLTLFDFVPARPPLQQRAQIISQIRKRLVMVR
jgi:hypothetical protein